MTDKQIKMVVDLICRDSYEPLTSICNGIQLKPFQTLLAAWIIIQRKFICTLDTGLGKTVIASAVMKWLHNAKETEKFVYVVENAGLRQTASKVGGYTGLRVLTCNATEARGLELFDEDEDFDILMISYQALQSYPVAAYLVENIEHFNTIIFDECQWVSQLHNSNTWEIVTMMRDKFRDVIMFSATPFKTNPLQLLKQVELLDPAILGNTNAYLKDKVVYDKMFGIRDWKDLPGVQEDLTFFVNGFTREDLGIEIEYTPIAHLIQGTTEQADIPHNKMFEIKGRGGERALEELERTLAHHVSRGEQGLVYCSTNENKEYLHETLTSRGFNVGVVDGTVSKKKGMNRNTTLDKYLMGEYDILLINITTSLDIPSNYCVFYELCDAGTTVQFIGRCIRGLADCDVVVHFFITLDTYEVEYFYENLYKKSSYLQATLGKDETVMKTVKQSLDKVLNSVKEK